MIRLAPAPDVRPREWFVAFHRRTPVPWVRRLAVGRFKHVQCFGFVAGLDAWLFVDHGLYGTDLRIVGDAAADVVMAEVTAGATLLRYVPSVRPQRKPIRFAYSCVSLVQHVTGIRSGALLPTRLYADFLADGAEPIGEPDAVSDAKSAGPEPGADPGPD